MADSYIEAVFSIFMALLLTASCLLVVALICMIIYALYKAATDETWR